MESEGYNEKRAGHEPLGQDIPRERHREPVYVWGPVRAGKNIISSPTAYVRRRSSSKDNLGSLAPHSIQGER